MATPIALASLATQLPQPKEGGGLFDLVGGLPVHPLVVHVAVVVLPLAAVALVVIMALPRVHTLLRWGVIAALAVGTLAAWIASESGESLAERVGEPELHQELGENLPTIAGITLALGVIWGVTGQLAARSSGSQNSSGSSGSSSWSGSSSSRGLFWVRIAVSVVTAGMVVYTVWYTILVGHSGAVATWLTRI